MYPAARSVGVLRHSSWDGVLVALSFVQAALLLTVPSIPLVAIGLWWNANTVSHNFVHLPFFRSRRLNALYAVYLSVLLGVPHHLWRQRHLHHHDERAQRVRWTRPLVAECIVIGMMWLTLALLAPRTFVVIYLPGCLVGLGLCAVHGYFEHARGTTSHYGPLYNLSFFNDGYHVEHHATPHAHWTTLRLARQEDPRSSRWPPVLRWLEAFSLEGLEQFVLRSRGLQRFVLARHERAFRVLLPALSGVRRVTIVGGGLFPRTALILRRLLPDARLTIVDRSAVNLNRCRTFLDDRVEFRHGTYDSGQRIEADLVVIPLAFLGNRRLVYANPPAPATLVHDWMWTRRAVGAPVSWWLLKRLNLVRV